MNVAVHLVAMPWANPTIPSMQLGCLHAHLLRAYGDRVAVRSYSAFHAILRTISGERFIDSFNELAPFGEYLYFALFARRFGFPDRRKSRIAIGGLLKRLNQSRFARVKATRETLDQVEAATLAFLDDRISPSLIDDGVNLVGFTVNYDQLYASLFALRYLLEKHREKHFAFVFGGMSAALPEVVGLLRMLAIPACCVVGEGEEKLQELVRRLAAIDGETEPTAHVVRRAMTDELVGVFHPEDAVELFERDKRLFQAQLAMDQLALPDYDEFFETARQAGPHATYLAARRVMGLPVEGTRGCFAKCDFCGLNLLWDGFRKLPAAKIVETVTALVDRYGIPDVRFMDNVCDTWAEAYADELIERGVRLGGFLELRAHHREEYWTKLSLAGVSMIQVGIEALAPQLLARINKGTRVIQNVAVHKYLAELGIVAGSALICHHPRSTLDDVCETRRVIEHIPHLESFLLNRYRLAMGSPLFNELPIAERRAVVPYLEVALPRAYAKYMVGWGYQLPRSLELPEDVRVAWDEFELWYDDFMAKHARHARLNLIRPGRDRILLLDTRYSRAEEHLLEGSSARLYDHCHGGARRQQLLELLGLDEGELDGILEHLQERKVLLKLGEHYLAIAVRPRDELVRRCLTGAGRSDIGAVHGSDGRGTDRGVPVKGRRSLEFFGSSAKSARS